MSKIRSTPKMRAIPALGTPMASRIIISIIIPAPGTAAVPIDARTAVSTMVSCAPRVRSIPNVWAINTAATKNPKLLQEASKVFGSQCIVSSIEAKKVKTKKWEAYADNGREKTNLDVIDWTKKVQDLGVGEILLTSVDRDGTESGLDEELIEEVSKKTQVSLIVSGGIGKPEDYLNCIKKY